MIRLLFDFDADRVFSFEEETGEIMHSKAMTLPPPSAHREPTKEPAVKPGCSLAELDRAAELRYRAWRMKTA